MAREYESVRIFDADNHYYEPFDGIVRHLSREHRARVLDCAVIDGKRHHIIAGKVDRSIVNPSFDPIAKPGALFEWFRGNARGVPAQDYLEEREPIPDYYHSPESRVKLMDSQDLDQCWLFPTAACMYEEPLSQDPGAVTLFVDALNRWLLEDWTFNYQDRIFAAPYVSLANVDHAARTVDWALEHGARILVMRPAIPVTAQGPIRPADPMFDPFWSRVAEAGITVVIHNGNSGYTSHGYAEGSSAGNGQQSRFASDVQIWRALQQDRPIFDIFAALLYDRLFERFPSVRVASVENGCRFLPDLFYKMGTTRNKLPGHFKHDPVDLFKHNVWVNPFWEDELDDLVELLGADRVLFGSDWPHVEGLPDPKDYILETKRLSDADRAKVMGGNARELNTFQPAK